MKAVGVCNCRSMTTLQKRFQHPVHDSLWEKPPLEQSVVRSSGAHHPLEIMRPAHVGHVSRVANVLFELSRCFTETEINFSIPDT